MWVYMTQKKTITQRRPFVKGSQLNLKETKQKNDDSNHVTNRSTMHGDINCVLRAADNRQGPLFFFLNIQFNISAQKMHQLQWLIVIMCPRWGRLIFNPARRINPRALWTAHMPKRHIAKRPSCARGWRHGGVLKRTLVREVQVNRWVTSWERERVGEKRARTHRGCLFQRLINPWTRWEGHSMPAPSQRLTLRCSLLSRWLQTVRRGGTHSESHRHLVLATPGVRLASTGQEGGRSP